MRRFSCGCAVAALLLAAACSETSVNTILDPATIPEQGIYQPEQVVVTLAEHQAYEFAAAGLATFTKQQVSEVAYCRASLFARDQGYSGWFIKNEIETVTPWMREMNITAVFYRGKKPPLVTNKNGTNWCRA